MKLPGSNKTLRISCSSVCEDCESSTHLWQSSAPLHCGYWPGGRCYLCSPSLHPPKCVGGWSICSSGRETSSTSAHSLQCLHREIKKVNIYMCCLGKRLIYCRTWKKEIIIAVIFLSVLDLYQLFCCRDWPNISLVKLFAPFWLNGALWHVYFSTSTTHIFSLIILLIHCRSRLAVRQLSHMKISFKLLKKKFLENASSLQLSLGLCHNPVSTSVYLSLPISLPSSLSSSHFFVSLEVMCQCAHSKHNVHVAFGIKHLCVHM